MTDIVELSLAQMCSEDSRAAGKFYNSAHRVQRPRSCMVKYSVWTSFSAYQDLLISMSSLVPLFRLHRWFISCLMRDWTCTAGQ